jgi:hypothetical protein
MKALLFLFFSATLLWSLHSCKSSSAPPSFCDTACLKDTIKFSDEANPLKPYVYISARNCSADSLIWNHLDMGVNRKMGIVDLVGAPVKLNPSAVACYIKDTSYAWLTFNDCSNGRGYLLKIPFNKKENISRKSSAINSLDPKYSVDPSLVAYSDRGNLFAEDKVTGKSAMITFGERIEINYDAIHDFIDSVNITPTRFWARVKIADGWKEIEKAVELK